MELTTTEGGASRPSLIGAELTLLGAACAVMFFVGLGRFEFIGTEGLRAIVVKEMAQRPGYTMPTVHHVPYLRKPPLYAWTATWLARRFATLDEWVARLPSAVCATLLILLTYVAGRRWIGPGAGYAAAVLLLTNVTVLDYGVRAELDVPFSLFCAAAFTAMVCALGRCARPSADGEPRASARADFPAKTPLANAKGNREHERIAVHAACWLLAYAFALAGSLWKGPHVLIFMWLALIAHGWFGRDWRWLRSPAQWIGLAGCLGVLVWWSRSLAAFSSGGDVGKIALIEIIERLVPHSVGDILGIILFPAITLVVTIPASVFIVTGMVGGSAMAPPAATGASTARGWTLIAQAVWERVRDWVRSAAGDRAAYYLLVLIVPNLVFLMVAPAKAPRYTLPIFAPIALLAAWAVERRFVPGAGDGHGGAAAYDATWRHVGVVLLGLGGAAVAAAALSALDPTWLGPPLAWVVLAAGLGAAGFVLRRVEPGWRHARFARWTCLLCVALAAKPVIMSAWWPGRLKSDAMRAHAADINAAVPPGATVYVLKNDDAPDVAFYSARRFQYVPTVRDAASSATGSGDPSAVAPSWFLMRRGEFGNADPNPSSLPGYREVLTFIRNDRQMVLFELVGRSP